MNLTQKAAAGLGLARVRVLGHRVPVAVRMNLCNRCHSRCDYCSLPYTPTDEMSTDEVARIVRDLAGLGTQCISLSGGEPMLRGDLGEIVDACVRHGVSVEMNSTGYLFSRRREMIRKLALVKFSVDGSEAVHDEVRGRKGSFRELEQAIEVVKELGVRFSFAFTMTKRSLPEVPFALSFARSHDALIAFQPVMAHKHSSEDVRATFPDRADYLRTIDYLQEQQRRPGSGLRNSAQALEHIRGWPDIHGMKCWAGEAFAVIEPNGDVLPCDRIEYSAPIPNCRDKGVAWALSQLPEKECAGCGFSGAVEINMLMAGKVGILPSLLRVVKGD
jgi:MoaA/NifB/PqqE/SkfB family radical SAM enzyme